MADPVGSMADPLPIASYGPPITSYGPGGPWKGPGGSLEGLKRVKICFFCRFEAIRNYVRPGFGQIDGVSTSYGPPMTSFGPWGPWAP